jgi:signal transduction histidine kinase
MNDVLAGATLDKKTRGELDELARTLKSNLEKVVQHGKRADSIVKNMLLHSREGSGEHRLADINSLLDESLNLAYHGARAEKGEFNITVQRDFDVDAGTIELFPQEITRAFLNLISNGVYAATRRKTEDHEPPRRISEAPWKFALATTAPASRPRCGKRCSTRSSRRSRPVKGPALVSR